MSSRCLTSCAVEFCWGSHLSFEDGDCLHVVGHREQVKGLDGSGAVALLGKKFEIACQGCRIAGHMGNGAR